MRPAAAAIAAAVAAAWSGGTIESTSADSATTASRSGTSSIPAASASARVRSLLPATVATTRCPPAAYAAPTALPIAPGLTMPTVSIARP